MKVYSKEAENNLEANDIGLWKKKGGSCLYIHLYYRSVHVTDLFDLHNKKVAVVYKFCLILIECNPN